MRDSIFNDIKKLMFVWFLGAIISGTAYLNLNFLPGTTLPYTLDKLYISRKLMNEKYRRSGKICYILGNADNIGRNLYWKYLSVAFYIVIFNFYTDI